MPRPPDRLELLQGTLDMLILRTLLFGPAHGHQIAKHIEQTTDDLLRVEHGSLYPALHRLVRNGWIVAQWERPKDRNREFKFYRLTPAGRRQLARRGVPLGEVGAGDLAGDATRGGHMSFWSRRSSRDDELDREIRDHLELEAEELQAHGVDAESAAFAARRRFGNVGVVKEAVRASWGSARWDIFGQDLRYAVRGLRRSPAFTLTAVLSLTLGIGANTTVFSLIDALLLRTLPVHDPGRLVQLTLVDSGKPRLNFSYVAIRAFAEQAKAAGLTGVCGFALGESFTIGAPGSDRRATGTWMTGDCHRTLGVPFTAGRGFSSDDDRPEGGANGLVAVISHDYWARDLNGAPGVLGTPIIVDGKPVTIIGVTGPGFTGPNVGRTADITMPVTSMVQLRPNGPPILRPGMNWLRMFGRLEPGVRAEHAAARINVAWPRLAEIALTPAETNDRRGTRVVLTPGGTGWSELRSQFTRPLVVLMGIVSLVLLITCANLASLLLARASVRRREFAVRLALGAGRARLIRQVFTEGLLLAAVGGGAAVAFAQFASRALVALLSAGRARPIALDVRPDVTVLAFALGMALLTSVLFGLAPALRATAVAETSAMRDSTRSRAARRGRLASILVVTQAALSLVLVAGAALFARTLDNLLSVDSGFRRDSVTLVSVEIPRAARESARDASLAQEILDDMRALPGVRAASVSGNLPLSGGGWTLSVRLEDNPAAGKADAEILTASPSYFDVFGIALRAGREFSRSDGAAASPVAIVNESFVRDRFGMASPIGRRIILGDREQPFEIVGVVQDVRSEGLRKPAPPAVYLSFFQGPNPQLSGGATIGLLTERGGAVPIDAIRDRVRARSTFAAVNVRRFKDLVDAAIVNERLMALLATFFGVLALALAAVGLYGLLSFGVSGRTTEIGVRSALGATRGSVMWLVMSDALRLVGAGVVLGLPAIWATTRLVSGMLFGLTATDPAAIATAVGVLLLTALIAAYVPARRAVRVSPITALRSE